MTIWSYSISWSKLRLALDCPRQLQHTIDKKKHGYGSQSYWALMGTLVQKVYELYFNQQVNLREKGRDDATIAKVADRVIDAVMKTNPEVSYRPDQTEEGLINEAKAQVISGIQFLKDAGILTKRVRSEVKLNGTFRGFRMFAMVDFLVEDERNGDEIYDGKGYAQENADPRQVVYYALNRASSGRKLAKAGLIYWKHGFREVDVSPKALREFIDGDIASVRPLLEELKKGVTGLLPTKPSPTTCGHCNWRDTCEDSLKKKTEVTEFLPEDTGFREER